MLTSHFITPPLFILYLLYMDSYIDTKKYLGLV